ncbi:MAG: DNA N-6-adenine-methyltransferase [Gammaproteobacteria bacterium]
MGAHEQAAKTDEWYTPGWVFTALSVNFDLDPCAGSGCPSLKWADNYYFSAGLGRRWFGSVWLNPPFGTRNAVLPWLEKMVAHGDGIALLPNRTDCPWWQYVAAEAGGILFHAGRIKFERGDGPALHSPGFGNCFMSFGDEMTSRLMASELRGLWHGG